MKYFGYFSNNRQILSKFRWILRGYHSYPWNDIPVFYAASFSLYIYLFNHILVVHLSPNTRCQYLLQKLHFLIIFKLWGPKTPLKWRFFETTSLYTFVVLNELYNFWPIRIDVCRVVGELRALKVLYVWLCAVTLAKPVF